MLQNQDKIKISYILPNLERGGTERQVIEIVNRIDKNRFTPQILCLNMDGPLSNELKNGIKVEILNFKGLLFRDIPVNLSPILRFFKFLKYESPHIVHTFLYWPSIYGTFAAKLAGIPIIINSRRSLGVWKNGNPHYQWLENIVNLFADAIMVNSLAVKSDVIQNEKLNPAKVRLIYNGCDYQRIEKTKADEDEKRKELGIKSNDVVLGMIANLYPNKGQKYLLYVLPGILKWSKDIKVLLVGKGSRICELKEIAKSLNIENYVTFAGEREDIFEILKVIDIGILCSVYREGFSNAIVEMMAAGIPVVATNIGGNREIIIDGQTGFLVPAKDSKALADALIWLLNNREKAREMGLKGRERVKDMFSMMRCIKELEELYLELVKKRANANYI